LKSLCSESLNAWLAIGDKGYQRNIIENNMKLFRRSIYFVNDLKEGEVVSSCDIRRIRPGKGLPPKYFTTIVGKKLKVDVTRGTPTDWCQFYD
jgi:N-acetylneuraminate synthase